VDADEQQADEVKAAAQAARRELSEEAGLQVTPESLVRWAHWITPSAARRRFDTHFFLTTAPPEQALRINPAESAGHCWLTLPADGQIDGIEPLTPPTWIILQEIAAALGHAGPVSKLMQLAATRRVLTTLPKLTDEGQAIMPWSADYSSVAGEGIDWPDEAVAACSRWPERFRSIIAPRAAGTEPPPCKR
jgi:ADP-ribose pyrophosphatase YjhB (NUDIX family)